MICNHNIPKLIAYAEKTCTAIAGTKHDFRVDVPKPIVMSAAEKAQTRKKLSDLIGGFNNPKNLPIR